MDEHTKHIVASNLTIAYCANRPSRSAGGSTTKMFSSEEGFPHKPLKEEEIIEIYRRFLNQLDGPTESKGT